MRAKGCLICGKTFNPKNANARYCSKACSNQKRKAERKDWEAKNPDYMKNYIREYRDKEKE